jgi:hypothetical protein
VAPRRHFSEQLTGRFFLPRSGSVFSGRVSDGKHPVTVEALRILPGWGTSGGMPWEAPLKARSQSGGGRRSTAKHPPPVTRHQSWDSLLQAFYWLGRAHIVVLNPQPTQLIGRQLEPRAP